MFFTMIISLATIVLFSISLSQLASFLNLDLIDFNQIIESIQESTFEEMVPILSVLLLGFFQIFGFPLAIFLISLNGLASK